MHRRDFLARSAALFTAPLLASASVSTPRKYSARTVDLIAQSNVIDMLSLPTLNWQTLEHWEEVPGAFSAAEFTKLRSSGIDVFHPAVALETGSSYGITRAWFAKWNRLLLRYPDYFVRVDRPTDLTRAKREEKIGIILGMQDANHLRALEDVDEFYAMGQRVMQLTYNAENLLGAGCQVAHDRGLTPFGADVVARMNTVGMAIDVSHCGERTSLDAIAASKKPVLITHSNCRALAPGVARCKSDEVIQAAARGGGVLGITSVRNFVRAKGPASLDDVLNHFDYAVHLVGIEHVGIGSDFDLDAHPTYDIPGLNQSSRVYELTEGLVKRGYADEHLALILGGNFERALEQIWT